LERAEIVSYLCTPKTVEGQREKLKRGSKKPPKVFKNKTLKRFGTETEGVLSLQPVSEGIGKD
ncbi:hypothetical protein QWY31_16460, partial [Cytophagales bacterium LB-30]